MKMLFFMLVFLVPLGAQAESTTAQALLDVRAAISIAQVNDLDFGFVYQGASAGTVATGDAGAAEFTVTGAPSTAYTVTLPADGVVTMITAGGGVANKEVDVSSFVSNPAAGANGMLSAGGVQTLLVGATHAAIPSGQVVGAYAATFTVDVIY